MGASQPDNKKSAITVMEADFDVIVPEVTTILERVYQIPNSKQ